MFYIRPPSRIAIPAAVKPIGTHESVKEDDLAVSKASADAPQLNIPVVERRKQRDRRNGSRDSLLETRSSKDRRKSGTPSISITV